jgi:hypothetical protein
MCEGDGKEVVGSARYGMSSFGHYQEDFVYGECGFCEGTGEVQDFPDYDDCDCNECHTWWWCLVDDTDLVESCCFKEKSDAEDWAEFARKQYETKITVCQRDEDDRARKQAKQAALTV